MTISVCREVNAVTPTHRYSTGPSTHQTDMLEGCSGINCSIAAVKFKHTNMITAHVLTCATSAMGIKIC